MTLLVLLSTCTPVFLSSTPHGRGERRHVMNRQFPTITTSNGSKTVWRFHLGDIGTVSDDSHPWHNPSPSPNLNRKPIRTNLPISATMGALVLQESPMSQQALSMSSEQDAASLLHSLSSSPSFFSTSRQALQSRLSRHAPRCAWHSCGTSKSSPPPPGETQQPPRM